MICRSKDKKPYDNNSGQTTFEKYKCIRCMRDDRVGDAAYFQIDQCLTCTRFEPVFGQVYEILNDLGVNVAQVLDDLQSSYMNNDDYVRLSRIEEYQTELKPAKFDLTKVLVAENDDDTGYDDLWGNGIKVNWNLVPLEEQKCHISWRQAIDDDGSGLGKLGSWMEQGVGTSTGYGVNGTSNNPERVNVYLQNQKDMNEKKADFSKWVNPAIEIVDQKVGTALVNCANDLNDIKNIIGSGTDIDPTAVLAASVALETQDYKAIVDKYRSIQTALGSGGANPALVWTAYGTENGMVKRYIDGTLEKWLQQIDDDHTPPAPAVKTIPTPSIIETGATGTGSQLGTVKQIVIHHFASSSNYSNSTREQRIDIVRGCNHNTGTKSSVDYHFVIFPDGEIYRGCPETSMGAHCGRENGKGGNTGRIGISYAGWYAKPGYADQAKTTWVETMEFSKAQEEAGVSLVAYLMQKYNLKPSRDAADGADINNDPNVTLIGHYELYEGMRSETSKTGCPGIRIIEKLDSWVEMIKSGGFFGVTGAMWTDFVKLIEEGLEKQGTTSTDGLGLFPKICFLYVNILSHQQGSQSDGGEWAFPFSDDDIRNLAPGKCVYVTGAYGEWRSYYNGGAGGKHEGVDLQPGGLALDPSEYASHHFPVRAMKDGTAFYQPDYCNGVMIVHNDGTCSRYLHMQNVKISDGQRVQKGDQLGEVSGASSASNMGAYPYHLHVEMMTGTSPDAKIGSTDQSIGMDPVSKWNSNNYKAGADGCIGKYSVD